MHFFGNDYIIIFFVFNKCQSIKAFYNYAVYSLLNTSYINIVIGFNNAKNPTSLVLMSD